jgi:hypothetical protein
LRGPPEFTQIEIFGLKKSPSGNRAFQALIFLFVKALISRRTTDQAETVKKKYIRRQSDLACFLKKNRPKCSLNDFLTKL